MYIEINNYSLKEEMIQSSLFKDLRFEDLSTNDVSIKARYTSDECYNDVLFSTEYLLQKDKGRFKNQISEFITILKNRKYHLDSECNNSLGTDITKNVNILISVRYDIHEEPYYFIFII